MDSQQVINIAKLVIAVIMLIIILKKLLPLLHDFNSCFIDSNAADCLNKLLTIVILLIGIKKIISLAMALQIPGLNFLSVVDPAFVMLEEFISHYAGYIVLVVLGAAVLRK